MARNITGIMENSDDIDRGIAATAIDQKMSRYSEDADGAAGAATTEEEMVCAKAWRELWPLSRTRAARLSRDVMDRLPQEVGIAESSGFAESRSGPL